jgi:hypothetical protein
MTDRALVLSPCLVSDKTKTRDWVLHFFRLFSSSETFTARILSSKENQGGFRTVAVIARPVTDGVLPCLSPVSWTTRHNHGGCPPWLTGLWLNDGGHSEQRLFFACDSFVSIMLLSKKFKACSISINSKVELTLRYFCLTSTDWRRTVAYDRFKITEYSLRKATAFERRKTSAAVLSPVLRLLLSISRQTIFNRTQPNWLVDTYAAAAWFRVFGIADSRLLPVALFLTCQSSKRAYSRQLYFQWSDIVCLCETRERESVFYFFWLLLHQTLLYSFFCSMVVASYHSW